MVEGCESEMNVLVSIDNNYMEQLIVMLNSLFIHNKCKIEIYLMYGSLTKSAISKISTFVSKKGNRIHTIKVEEGLFKNSPKRSHTSIETYYRLLAFQILEEHVEKILYLDPDIIVTGSLKQLYATDLSERCFAGVPDYGINKLYPVQKRSIGMPMKYQYVNAGMLLMNLKLIRQKITIEKLFTFIEKNGNRFKLQDQDVINAYFYKDIIYIPAKYNQDIWYHNFFDIITYPLRQFIPINTPIVIHYMGSEYKPWKKNGFGGKRIKEYQQYCAIEEVSYLREQVKKNSKNWARNYMSILKRYVNGEDLCK